MSQWLIEYYLLNEQLSFVLEKTYHYNRPFYQDSSSLGEDNDEVFDFDKSEIEEDRFYFDKGKLIHLIITGDCGAPFARNYLIEEQERIKKDFEFLLKEREK